MWKKTGDYVRLYYQKDQYQTTYRPNRYVKFCRL